MSEFTPRYRGAEADAEALAKRLEGERVVPSWALRREAAAALRDLAMRLEKRSDYDTRAEAAAALRRAEKIEAALRSIMASPHASAEVYMIARRALSPQAEES